MRECLQSISIQNCGSDVRFELRHVFGGIDLYSVHWVMSHFYAEGGATEAYGSRAVCHYAEGRTVVVLSVRPPRISRHSLKTKR